MTEDGPKFDYRELMVTPDTSVEGLVALLRESNHLVPGWPTRSATGSDIDRPTQGER